MLGVFRTGCEPSLFQDIRKSGFGLGRLLGGLRSFPSHAEGTYGTGRTPTLLLALCLPLRDFHPNAGTQQAPTSQQVTTTPTLPWTTVVQADECMPRYGWHSRGCTRLPGNAYDDCGICGGTSYCATLPSRGRAVRGLPLDGGGRARSGGDGRYRRMRECADASDKISAVLWLDAGACL